MEEAAELLRNLTDGWWHSQPTVIAVAYVLDDFGAFDSPADVMSFFVDPKSWEPEITDIVRDVAEEAAVRVGS